MLVLTRFPKEEVVITTKAGERIIVEVVEVKGDKVRLGLTADKDVTLHRREVQDQIDLEQKRLAKTAQGIRLKGGLSSNGDAP